ncbi:MAG: EF-hand domain-containing protein [Endozoicomonas sp. (ex Botrylloides leachii)]|nr:EF-hand domain-containing protein [Endozoicomonas sp. (ex Botrylloides leachii)]
MRKVIAAVLLALCSSMVTVIPVWADELPMPLAAFKDPKNINKEVEKIKADFKAHDEVLFKKMDANNDGVVTKKEFMNKRIAYIEKITGNALSEADAKERAENVFSFLDTNDKGKITLKQYEAGMQTIRTNAAYVISSAALFG